ncbi:MAG TPA: HipA family kinase [Methylocella sp.]
MSEIQFATVLPGAKGFKEGNVNETFRGQILLANGTTVKSAVIKDLDKKQLVNELLASVLAHAAALPTPDAHLALVRASDLVVNKAPRLADGNRLVFASVDVKMPNITFRAKGASPDELKQLFKDITEWGDLGHLYAFDSWVANIDRHPGNLLFGNKSEIWLIDHGHCFSGPAWQPDDLNPHAEYRNRLSEWLTCHLKFDQKNKRSSEVKQFIKLIACLDLSDCSKKSRIEGLIPADEIDAVEVFLKDRINDVLAYSNKALGILI